MSSSLTDESSSKGKENEHTESDKKSGEKSSNDERLKSPATQSNSDLLDHNDNSLDVKHGMDHVFSGDSGGSLNNRDLSRDLKYSRRKMEKPRKRKQEFDIEETFLEKESLSSQTYCDNSFSDLVSRSMEQNMQCASSHSPDLMCPPMTSPIPQDLSLKSTTTTSESLGDEWRRTGAPDHQSGAIASSSVKELEAVMNRHLPVISCNHYNIDLSHKSSRQTGSHQAQKKSTIQWVGSQPPATTETLPATNLLRSIYANRESVIRTNARPGYYPEMPINMLTPPGNESYKDQSHSFGMANPPPITHKSNGPYSATTTNYSSSPISVSMTTPIDSYGITPPSSVSPREKLQSPFAETQSYAETSVVSCANISSEPLSSRQQTMKPTPPHTYQLVAAAATSQDYCATKYGAPSSFSSNALYCDSTANSYEPCSRSVLPWYPVSYTS